MSFENHSRISFSEYGKIAPKFCSEDGENCENQSGRRVVAAKFYQDAQTKKTTKLKRVSRHE